MSNPNKAAFSGAPKPVLVVAGIVLSPEGTNPRVLLARRKHNIPIEAGKWEFPGGKVEPLEHPEFSLARELREELDLEITVERIFDVASHIYITPDGPVHIILLCYLCRAFSEEFQLIDVSDARWVSAKELTSFDFAAADVATVAKLGEYLTVSSSVF